MTDHGVERKLTAILAADVAGYSRLVGLDEEGTLARLRALHQDIIDPQIASHRGRIVKTTGDGLLVEFASVVDAVRCAVSVQRAVAEEQNAVPDDRRIRFRIGVNLGDIVVQGEDILGDGVNVAARLEGIAEPGGICISASAYEQVDGKVEVEFGDLGDQTLKNIARPVRAYQVRDRRIPIEEPLRASSQPLPLPDKPSIAVLPFTNISSDPEQEFLADGIAEDVITALSHHPWLFVIARNSCFTYKGRAVEVRQVGRELGVRYVLEGSLRRAGNRIRVTAQLVEAETGNHIWAERYDRDLADIFAVQDEITEAVTIAVAPAVARAEQKRAMRQPPNSLDAWAAYQHGVWHLSKLTAQDTAAAEKFFQQAIDLDPTFSAAHANLALTRYYTSYLFWSHGPIEPLSSIAALARNALALDSNDAETRSLLGLVLLLTGDYEGALAETERALALCPNLAIAHAVLGITLIWSGQPKEGLKSLERYFRLNPNGPSAGPILTQVAVGHYFCREYKAAVDAAKRAIQSFPDYPITHFWLPAALGQLGRALEAKEALQKATAIGSGLFDMYARNRRPIFRTEDYAHMLEGLRKAGWDG
jgi:adenylate cyclase